MHTNKETEKTCAERWAQHYTSRLADLRELWRADCEGEESVTLSDYGLSFDYVRGERGLRAFWRWQFSTGGPGEELRFFSDGPDGELERAEFALLDWSDVETREVEPADYELAENLWAWLRDCGATEHAWKEDRL